MAGSVLVVEDDAVLREFLVEALAGDGIRAEAAANGREGLARLGAGSYDVVVTDLRMPVMDGMTFLREGRALRPEARWIVITAHGSIAGAVEAMKAGAVDYLTKPLSGPGELRRVVRRALHEAESEERIRLLAEEAGRDLPPVDLVFLGAAMERLRPLVREVAATPATVLLTGASGTGKELVARVIHAWSPRSARPFVAVNCAALAETLLESELFGHERGAFTGATSARKGRFELAEGGTLFLDEAGEIPAPVQVKLLRVLQEREVERLGGARPVPVDVRLVAATNRDLKALVAAGSFREDLYYRLNVFPLELPPLSARRDAILALAAHFRERFSARFGKRVTGFAPEAEQALLAYAWPGNVRELQNVVERAVILARERIGVEHLGLDAACGDEPQAGGLLRDVERAAIERVLRDVGGNRRRAAEALGISLRTLQYRIKEYGLS